MASKPNDISITSLRGGLNDTDPPNALAMDQCVVANNVEFFQSMLGERRNGCQSIPVTGSGLDTTAGIVHLSQWFPTGDVTSPELFSVGATEASSVVIAKRTNFIWSTISPVDAPSTVVPSIYEISTQPFHDKMFFSYRSSKNRTHLWDGTNLRLAGLSQPSAPTAANQGSGSVTRIRYYRVRYVIKNGATVVTRSEPSLSLPFTPSGTGASVRVTKPATISENETHWELEASNDDANYYLISTLPVGTTFYDDTVSLSNTSNTIPSNVVTPLGYVLLSNKAAALNLTGTVSNGSYSNGTSFPARGWVGYTGAGAYISEGAWPNPPNPGDIYFASQDVATALETPSDPTSGKDYADIGTLSEDIGEYLTLPAAKYLAVDTDRLILAGHWTDTTLTSQVAWTPVSNDPGVGNSERLPLSVSNTLQLDPTEGGPITGISSPENGTWYAFKWSHIYKLVRTGDLQHAYDVITMSKSRGAIPGSIVTGIDEAGASCIYFLDPLLGPSRIGPGGIELIVGLRGTWARINLQASKVIARSTFYPFKMQVHWWLAVDGSDSPNLKIILQTTELERQPNGGVAKGWSTATGVIAQAFCATNITEVVSIDGVNQLSTRPFIGMLSPNYIQRCDVEITDAGTTYVATVRTRPFLTVGLLNKWGAMRGALLATPNASSSVTVKFIRDLGLETNSITTALTPSASEVLVIKPFDDLVMSNATTIQIEISD